MKIIGDLYKIYEARRRREEARAAIFFGGGCLIFIVCGIIILIVTAISNTVESTTVRSTYGETYASACQPVPAGTDSMDNLPDAASPRAILLLIADTQRRHAWHSQLPAQWQAENEDDMTMIGCIEQEWVELETCEYERPTDEGSYTVRIDREQEQLTIVLINPQTSRRIDSLTVSGTEPDACPDDDGKFGSGQRRGEEVQWDDVAAWIEGHVFD